MRISTDGFIDVRRFPKIRTPGNYEVKMEPMPEAEAVAFLLSHSFPNHRKIVRPLSPRACRKQTRASWATSINERMTLVDQVWRGITTPVPSPKDPGEPELIQVVRVDGVWAHPLYLDGSETRVLPTGGIPLSELKKKMGAPFMDLGGQKSA